MSDTRIVDLLDVTYDYDRQAGILLLREAEGARRTLAIPVALTDAQQVWRVARGESRPRPSTHEIALDLLARAGAQVVSAVVTRQENGVFFAEVHLMTSSGPEVSDERPSDAIALALRHVPRAPLLVAGEVLAHAGF
ncbi:MAG: bifunctional nuclease family protein [Acidobacteria bacterium]|nr:bifunctional nuclease family protein [Acidobacteriota bacterium]